MRRGLELLGDLRGGSEPNLNQTLLSNQICRHRRPVVASIPLVLVAIPGGGRTARRRLRQLRLLPPSGHHGPSRKARLRASRGLHQLRPLPTAHQGLRAGGGRGGKSSCHRPHMTAATVTRASRPAPVGCRRTASSTHDGHVRMRHISLLGGGHRMGNDAPLPVEGGLLVTRTLTGPL